MEQSNEEMAEKDFLLTENEINLKELEAAVKTFNCTLQEKYKLLQVLGLASTKQALYEKAYRIGIILFPLTVNVFTG